MADRGAWRPPPADPADRGRGHVLIRSCMETIEIDSSPAGTSVLMDRHLRRAPVLATADDVPVAALRRPAPAADITAVSHLASTGVQALHELAEQMAADARALRLIAPAGSPAGLVLRLTGLDHLVVPCER